MSLSGHGHGGDWVAPASSRVLRVQVECGSRTGQMAPNRVQQAAVLGPEGEEVAWPSWSSRSPKSCAVSGRRSRRWWRGCRARWPARGAGRRWTTARWSKRSPRRRAASSWPRIGRFWRPWTSTCRPSSLAVSATPRWDAARRRITPWPGRCRSSDRCTASRASAAGTRGGGWSTRSACARG